MYILYITIFVVGTASNLADLRREFEERCQVSGRQLRIEKILYTGKEGKTSTGCPLAKWIIRRADAEEKILVVVKKRPGHRWVLLFRVSKHCSDFILYNYLDV